MLKVTDNHSYCSQNDFNEHNFVWKIHGHCEYYDSPEFSAGKIKLALNIRYSPGEGTLFLNCIKFSGGEFSINCEIRCLNKFGKTLDVQKKDISLNNKSTSIGLFKVMTRFGSDPRIIICKLRFLDIFTSQNKLAPPFTLENPLAQKFENPKYSDFTFSVSGKEFRAHKFILAARSLIFEKMFEDETKDNIIFMNDVTPEVFKEILHFIYTGNVASEKISYDLLESAKNFGFDRLIAICARHLCSTVSTENVCEFLILADKYDIPNLKTKIINFISLNAEEVMKSNSWKLIKTSTDLLKEINKAILLEYAFWEEISTFAKNESSNFIVDTSFGTTNTYRDSEKSYNQLIIENYKSACVRSHGNIKYGTITSVMISNKLEIPDCDLRSHLTVLLKNPKYSDFTFDVSGKKLHVHKLILSARSPVFQAMFEHDMEESRNNEVVISDINLKVFEKMLKYIYTGSVSHITEIAKELFCAADKYALEELKLICIQNLSKFVSVHNVSETLIFAEALNLNELKRSAIECIKENLNQVMIKDSWKSILETHPILVSEICEAIVKK